ncbi:MAG TPA: Tim44 domain-containing protein, partial [Beijerinckiaceae bacterium]|nr:Tim44 domain-containing protein [Beijerinckiaceae bacterium]
ARPGRSGGSFGSRGGRTYDAPPATRTAPTPPAQPMQRSQAPQPGPNMQRPAPVPQAQAAQPRRFGFGTGLFAGLLGAGLLGMLFGQGFFGGLAGLASMFGLLLQVGLIVGLVWLAVRFFRRRQQPALAGAPGEPMERSSLGGMVPPIGGGRMGGLGGLGGLGRSGPAPAQPRVPGRSDEVGIGPADYEAFERNLHEVSDAYSREDVGTLWSLATPEMAGYMQEDLNENARKGVVNKSSNVRLLQGDLAEAWREGDTDYATVAMRYAINDAVLDKATGRVIEGSPNEPSEVTELWTFRRDRGGPWKLSAIQQTA